MRGQARLRRWSMGGATGPITNFSSMERGKERKTTLKIKPLFQVAAGQSSKIITNVQSIHVH